MRSIHAAFLALLLPLGLTLACGSTTPSPAITPITATPVDQPGATEPVSTPAPTPAEILASSNLPEPLPQPLAGDPLAVTVHRLANGLTIYISTDRQTPRFSAWLAVRAGSRHDPADSTGLAHYLEHMLFKGTDELGTLDAAAEQAHVARIAALYDELRQIDGTADGAAKDADQQRTRILAEIDAETQKTAQHAIPNELDQLYARLGITGVNAFTSNEQTVYISDVPANRLEAWARVEAERFRDPVFRLFYPELEAVYEEKNISLDNPFNRVYEAMTGALFPLHPYGTQPTIGLAEHLKTPAYADMVAFFQRWYQPNNMAVVLAGDIDAETALPILEKHFGAWQPAPLASPAPASVPPVEGRQQRDIVAKGESAVYLAWQTVPMRHADRATLEVMDMLMDNAATGLINVDLVLSQKLPGAGSYPSHHIDAGFWAMHGTARDGQPLEDVEKLLLGVVEKLKAGEFTQADIDAILLHAEMREMREMESNQARVAKMADAYVHHQPWPEVALWTEQLRKVKRDDVIAAARKYLNDNYVAVYRRSGDHAPPKVPKPDITPVPIDPSRTSDFARDVQAMPATEVEPEWLAEGTHYMRRDLPAGDLLAVPNRMNQLFSLMYRFDFGARQQPLACFALDLLDQSGTRDLGPAELKRKLYAMGTTIDFDCDADRITLEVTGIDRNLEASVALLDTWLRKADLREDIRTRLVENTVSQRKDEMQEPRTIARALAEYAQRGKQSSFLAVPSNRVLQRTRVVPLRKLLAALPDYRHRTVYFGPRAADEAAGLVALGKRHKPAPRPATVQYRKVDGARIFLLDKEVAQSSISLVIPKQPLSAADRPLSRFYTEYVGGGMGALIFQEIREARGLAYSAGAYHSMGRRLGDQSGVIGYIGTQSDKTVDALATMLELLRKLPVQPGRLAMAQKSLAAEYRASRFAPRQVPHLVLAWDDMGIDADPRPASWKAIEAAGAAELEAFGQRFANGDLIIAITGDGARIDQEALGRIAPVQKVSVADIFGY